MLINICLDLNIKSVDMKKMLLILLYFLVLKFNL